MLLIPGAVILGAQNITNVPFEVDGDKIVLQFSIANASARHSVWVRPGLVTEDGKIDYDVMRSISGDYELLETPTGRKEIVWDISKDIGSLPSGAKFTVKVLKRRPVPLVRSIGLSGSTNAPLGLLYQQTSYWGFYASVKLYPFPRAGSGEAYPDGLVVGLNNPNGLYRFESKRALNSYSISAGPTRRLGDHSIFYLGLGYSVKELLWEVTEIDSELRPVNSFWAPVKDYHARQAMLEAGLLVRWRRLNAEIGAGMLASKELFANFGLGYIISNKVPKL